jgi:glyoxylase-like metal-dependent hydrolase (beta-lactamase superfamily II)
MALEIFACMVGRSKRNRGAMFLRNFAGDEIELTYPFWVIRDGARTVLVDIGFGLEIGRERGIYDYESPDVLLRRLHIEPADVTTAVISHLHYDHFSEPARLPNASFIVQADDLEYFTGRGRAHPAFHSANPAAIDEIPALRAQGRITVADGDYALDERVRLLHVGGHTPGSQIVAVHDSAGPVVLACDASHFYANLETRTPTSLIHSYEDYLRGFNTIETLARGGRWYPGHDPAMLEQLERVDERIYRVPR